MGRPATKRTEKRDAISPEMVKSWFGKNGAKISDETISRFIAAGKFYGSEPGGNELSRHANFISARAAFRAAKAAAHESQAHIFNVIAAFESELLPDGFRKSLGIAYSAATTLQTTLIDMGIEVEDELLLWPEVARDLLPLIKGAVEEAGFSPGAKTKNSRLTLVLRAFLKHLGWAVSAAAIEKRLVKLVE